MNPKARYTVSILIALGGVIAFFLIGVLVVNFVIMPWIVHQGRDVEVPSVVGLPLDEARSRLDTENLNAEVLAERSDSTQPAGYVADQRPRAGTMVKVGRKVGLITSSGLQRIRVPYLYGLSLTQAQSIVSNLGLAIARVESLACDSVQPGRIFAVEPAPFTLVDKSASLKIAISLGAQGSFEMPNLIGLRLADATKAIADKSLCLGRTKEVASEGEPGTVLVQSPEFGALVGAGDTVKLIVIGKAK